MLEIVRDIFHGYNPLLIGSDFLEGLRLVLIYENSD